jgi:predicted nucleic acid-binding protein
LIVVSDTSPILNLARIGRIDLLPALYGEVIIPSEVANELKRCAQDLPIPALDSMGWLTVAKARDRARVEQLREELDAGEAEAIALAIEFRASLLLVDERRGRSAATAAGLNVTGLLGMVAHANKPV